MPWKPKHHAHAQIAYPNSANTSARALFSTAVGLAGYSGACVPPRERAQRRSRACRRIHARLLQTKKRQLLNTGPYGHSTNQPLRPSLTSIENRLNKSCSMAIASCAASTVPKAGISLVLLDPGVGYFATGGARNSRRRRWNTCGNQISKSAFFFVAKKTRRWQGAEGALFSREFLSPNTNVARLALFSLPPSTMLPLVTQIV